MIAVRGVIRNRGKKRRLFDMSGLSWGKITPTDIDAFLDFGNRHFVVVEAKGTGVPVPYGQALALERLLFRIDQPYHINPALRCCGCVLIAEIEDGSMEDDVEMGECAVREMWRARYLEGVFRGREVILPKMHGVTVRKAIDWFVSQPLVPCPAPATMHA